MRRREIYDLLDLDPTDSDHRLMVYVAAKNAQPLACSY
jgi:hypothetical protein